MKVTRRDSNGVVILDLSGRLMGGAEASEFQQAVRDLVDEGKLRILVNLGDVTWINSTGLGLLIMVFQMVRKRGGALKFFGVTAQIRGILSITRLETVFDTYPDEAAALESETHA
jgi:anti-sigma B factor antagonist